MVSVLHVLLGFLPLLVVSFVAVGVEGQDLIEAVLFAQ